MGIKYDPFLNKLREQDAGTVSEANIASWNAKQSSIVFNVKDFGATGDGTTDDYASILSAINAADTAGGGTVFFPAGTYAISNNITLSGKSNLKLLGAGAECVKMIIPEAFLPNFGYEYMIISDETGTDIHIEGITFDGQYSLYTDPGSNLGGGLCPGKRWVVRNCAFTDSNYFNLWLSADCSDTKILHNRFYGEGRGNDNIGGGGASYIEIAHNVFEAELNGNIFDNVGGTNFKIHNNINKSPRTLYVEGMQHIEIYNNLFTNGGGIGVLSDAGYDPVSIVNSRHIRIYGNKMTLGAIFYRATSDEVKSYTIGGDVEISNNEIYNAEYAGILVNGQNAALGNNYIIAGNKITNSNTANATTWNTGVGVCHPSAINIMQGKNILVANNVCVDDRNTALHRYGIEIGQTYQAGTDSEPDYVNVVNNHINGVVSGKINVVSTRYTTHYFENNDPLDDRKIIVAKFTTTAPLDTNTYNNGIEGVGAKIYITNYNHGVDYSGMDVGGERAAVGDYILVKDELDSSHNGVYKVTVVGGGGATGELTRVAEFDKPGHIPSAVILVTNGTINANHKFIVTDQGPYTIGTTDILFSDLDRHNSYFNVKDFGAKGDNSTDDTVSIQAALNACDSTGGIVFFPQGTYITGALDVSSMTTCLGTGIGSKLKLKDSTNDFIFTTRDTIASPTSYPHDHQFRDLYFDLNKANNTTSAGAIKSTKNRNAIVERCSFVNFKGNCIYFSGGDGNNVQPRFINNQFDYGDRADGVGIKLDSGCYDSWVMGNDIGRAWRGIILSNGGDGNHSLLNNWTWANADCGIYLYQSHNVLLANNTQDQNYGTTADGAGMSIDGCNNVSIVNNKASNNSWRDINNIMGFGVTGTVNINSGIRVFGASTNIRISNSIFSNPNGGQQYGIKAEGNSVVYFDNCTFTEQVSGNINMVTGGTIISGAIEQAPTASAPTYVKGALYFDTTLNKLRIGGETAWETVTSS